MELEPAIVRSGGSLRGQIYNQLKTSILEGTIPAGESLSEVKLAQDLGVSRTPVRESLMQLELEGLVEAVPSKGVVVIGVSQKDIEDIYIIREFIEGKAARWACENIREEQIQPLGELVDLQEFYFIKGDIRKIWELDSRFHQGIYDCIGSRLIKTTLSNFHRYILRAREESIRTTGRAERSIQEHRDIFDAIAVRDSQRAEQAAIYHVRQAKQNLIEHFFIGSPGQEPERP